MTLLTPRVLHHGQFLTQVGVQHAYILIIPTGWLKFNRQHNISLPPSGGNVSSSSCFNLSLLGMNVPHYPCVRSVPPIKFLDATLVRIGVHIRTLEVLDRIFKSKLFLKDVDQVADLLLCEGLTIITGSMPYSNPVETGTVCAPSTFLMTDKCSPIVHPLVYRATLAIWIPNYNLAKSRDIRASSFRRDRASKFT